MLSVDNVYFNSEYASQVGFNYIIGKNKGKYAIMAQLYDIAVANNSFLHTNTSYDFETRLSKKQFLQVFHDLDILPVSCKVRRLGLFLKRITIKL